MKMIHSLISFFKPKKIEEPVMPSGPRIMRSTYPDKKADFNEWANHVHQETVRARFGEKTFK